MYNLTTEIPLILTVSFNNAFNLCRGKTTLFFHVGASFKKQLSSDFIWKGKCVITSNEEIIWDFENKCPDVIIKNVQKLYPDDRILKICNEMVMLSNL